MDAKFRAKILMQKEMKLNILNSHKKKILHLLHK